jgi:hypothetical protein
MMGLERPMLDRIEGSGRGIRSVGQRGPTWKLGTLC